MELCCAAPGQDGVCSLSGSLCSLTHMHLLASLMQPGIIVLRPSEVLDHSGVIISCDVSRQHSIKTVACTTLLISAESTASKLSASFCLMLRDRTKLKIYYRSRSHSQRYQKVPHTVTVCNGTTNVAFDLVCLLDENAYKS